MLLERRARGDDDDSNNNSNNTEYDGVTKLAEVYANELRLSAQAEARELRKHKRFDISEGNTNRGQRRAFPENDGMIRRRRDRWGFEAIKSDLELRKLERQNASASETACGEANARGAQSRPTPAYARASFRSCLAVCGVVGGSVLRFCVFRCCQRGRFTQRNETEL